MMTFLNLCKRHIKLFFKEKGLFLPTLITPLILLILYGTFLYNVFTDAFKTSIEQMSGGTFVFTDETNALINSFTSGQMVSSLLAVSCVTVAFGANCIMVFDRYAGPTKDFNVSPVKKSILALSYYVSSTISTLIILYITLGASFCFMAGIGWELAVADVFWLILDVFLLVNFGVALSSCIFFFVKNQGAMSGIASLVSAMYGFICGAYMPMEQFPEGLQKTLSLLPGTYGTSLLRYHSMNTTLDKFGFDEATNKGILESTDAIIDCFGNTVSIGASYGILCGTIVILVGIYVLMNALVSRKEK